MSTEDKKRNTKDDAELARGQEQQARQQGRGLRDDAESSRENAQNR